MLTYDKCEKCVHNEVCNRKRQFVTTINDLAELRVAVGDLLPLGLEQMEMTVNVRCKHYKPGGGQSCLLRKSFTPSP